MVPECGISPERERADEMTAHATFAPASVAISDGEKRHRRLLIIASAIVFAMILALILYGANYYTLSQADRPFSPKHHLLKPGGVVGINLGILGVLMLCGIFLYPLRKRWAWLQTRGIRNTGSTITSFWEFPPPSVLHFTRHSSFADWRVSHFGSC